MAPSLFICTVLLIQVLISSAQSSLKQYFHVTGQNGHCGLTNQPNIGYRQAMPDGLGSPPNNGLNSLMASGLGGLLNGGLTGLTSGGFPALSNAGMTAMSNSGNNVPNGGLAALGALASIPGLLQALTSTTAPYQPATVSTGVPTLKTESFKPSTTAPSTPTCKQNSPSSTPNGGLDSGVLNNLAIALQLLIVSNILNANLPENEANPIYELLETAKNIPVSFSQTETPATQNQKTNSCVSSAQSSYPSSSALQNYEELIRTYSEPSYAPNMNFLGTSGLTDFSVSDPYIKPTSRNSFQLMSPYEALGPNSPFTDPIIGSGYGSVISSKRDFHSPYVMMDSDPFAMNDLFS